MMSANAWYGAPAQDLIRIVSSKVVFREKNAHNALNIERNVGNYRVKTTLLHDC